MRQKPRRIRHEITAYGGIFFAIWLAAVLTTPHLGHAAIPPAGTQIQSQSQAEYFVGPDRRDATSNTVSTQVTAIYALQLTPPGTPVFPAFSIQGNEGDTLYAAFTIDNMGNAPDSAVVAWSLLPSSTIGVADVLFFSDGNANGSFDPGEDDPAFLAIAVGNGVALDVGVVLANGQGSGTSLVEIRASSYNDPAFPAQTSVLEAINAGTAVGTLHIGPFQNAEALPGGEGSTDDVMTAAIGYSETFVELRNEVANLGLSADVVEVVADTTGWPSGLAVAMRDSVGTPLVGSGNGFVVGAIGGGERRTLITTISTTGASLANVLVDTLSLVLEARSLNDTLRVNQTTDHVVPPPPFSAAGVLQLGQTFRENVAGFGDVVTLVVTVYNTSAVAPIDNVVVTEFVQPSLNFLSSPFFTANGNELTWNAGILQPGEKRQAAAKFIVNSRTGYGRTKVIGHASAGVTGGQVAAAGPEVNVLRIRNDIFGDEGILMGSVFVDDNGNGVRDVAEPGVAGVAVYLESGEYALTDSLGKFSIERAFSGYRVVRVDESTLPADVEWVGDPNWGNGEETSERLVHLLAGGHATASFPVKKIAAATPKLVTRSIVSHGITSVNKRSRVLYQIPAVSNSHFEPGKVFLKTEKLPNLDPIVEYLAKHPNMIVFLEGHTDSIPINTKTYPSNYELGLARASAVKLYLTANGIPEQRVMVYSYGESMPIATNSTREGRAKNRRVEVGFVRGELRDADVRTIKREQTQLQHLTELPDTFDVRVIWDITTSSPRIFDVQLDFTLPSALQDVDLTVKSGELEFGGMEGRFNVNGFRRSAGLVLEITASVAESDTASVKDIRTHLEFTTGDGIYASDDTLYSATVAPVPSAASTGGEVATLAEWMEAADELAAVAAPVSSEGATQLPDGNRIGFVDPADGSVVSRMDQVTVTVRAPIGGALQLSRNGVAVDDGHVGQKVVRIADGVEEVTYYGVKLEPGWNTLVMHAAAVSGTTYRDSVAVALAGRPTALGALQNHVLLPADGFSTQTMGFSIRDEVGLDVVDGVVATVVEGESLVLGADARPAMPGYQVTSRNGRYDLLIRSSRETMRRTVAVEVAGLRAACDVAYVPPRRPAFLTGIAEARFGSFSTSGDADPVGLDNYEDGAKLGGDARLFLQGTGFRGINLTARMDTRKRQNDPIFKSINPERQYSIYGDHSEIRYSAPAERGNYVAVEKGESFARYGDFESPLSDGEFLRYQRTATGVTGALVSGNDGVKGFITKTDFATIRDEIPGDGTSGFYYLSRRPVVENSLDIVIEIRDRFRLEKIIEVRPLALNRDYTVNYFNGAVLFKEPVSVTTFDLNPVMIVARYEVQTTSEASYLFGLRGDVVRKGGFRVGSSAVARGGNNPDYALYGLDGGVTLGPLGISGELARSEDDVAGDGLAYKIGATLSNDVTETSFYYRNVDDGFQNPTFSGSAHELFTRKTGFDTRVKVSEQFTLEGEGFYHEFNKTDEKKSNIAGIGVYRNKKLSLSGGVRAARHDVGGVEQDGLLALAGFGVQQPGTIEFGTHWEQNLGGETVEDYPNRLRSTAGVPFSKRFKAVLTHEYLSAHERDDTHQLLAGVEAQAGRHTTAYSKYSLNRTASNERMGAVSGLRQNIPLRKDLSGTLDVEGFRSFSNALNDEYFAVKSGLNWKRPGVAFAEGQYEYRWQRASTRHLLRVNAARQFDGGLALLLRQATSITTPDQGSDALSFDGRIAGAYRPDVSPVWTLLLLKSLYDRRTPIDPDAITWKLVFSTDINVIPKNMHEIRTKLAVKYVENYSEGFSETTNNYLALAQYIYRFSRRWDFDAWGRYMGQDGSGTDQLGAGVELGYLFFDRVRVGAGYSVNGFEEKDMAEKEAWENGFGLRVQLLLTDWILNGIGLEK